MPEKPSYGVRFEVEEHPDVEYESVSVEKGVVDGASEEERAVIAADEQSSFTHVETLAIEEVGHDG